jgi:hypothetical protein
VDYILDLSGRVITELSVQGAWNRGEVYAGSRHLATYSGGTTGAISFSYTDWLGSERVRTSASADAGATFLPRRGAAGTGSFRCPSRQWRGAGLPASQCGALRR